MGNSSSSSSKHTDDTVDFGYLVPQGVYTGPRDWNQAIVTQLVCARRLAPFYRPLEDYEESWTEDQILAARKELPDPEQTPNNDTVTRVETGNSTHSNKSSQPRKTNLPKESGKPETGIYRGAVECPICFLYYPPNINHSRCCDQAICTECFVQIKRNEPTPTHLVSEPAACPYCVQENFGIIYKPPSWRAGVGSEGFDGRGEGAPQYATHKRRNKNVGHDAPEVVTTDTIRPDWEAKLAAVQAAVARRANRRIIMRQVGDRLIPVGVTSGRVHAINPEDAQAEGEGGSGNGSSRRRRRQQQQQQAGQTLDQFLGSMGMAGPDLEELMVMEAMRLSLVEHEAQQKKEAEEKKKKEAAAATSDAPNAGSSSQAPPPAEQGDSTSPQTSSSSAPSATQLQASKGGSSLSSLRDKWQSARTSPPPFSTMKAALSAASTAGAVLAKSPDASERSPPLGRATDPSDEPTVTPTAANADAVGTSAAAESRNHVEPSASSTDQSNSHATTSTGESVAALSSVSQASSLGSEASGLPTIDSLSYNPLPSSPESVVTLSGDRALLASPADTPIDAVPQASEGQRPEGSVSPSTRC